MATHSQRVGLAVVNEPANATRKVVVKTVRIAVVNGAAAGVFDLPTGAKVLAIHAETATAIPGSPDDTDLRLGSGANGQQYVADVDVSAQGFVPLTLLYAARNPAATVHYTVASSGGTTADQDGEVLLHIEYMPPLA